MEKGLPIKKHTVCILTTSHGVKDDRIFHKEAISLKRRRV